ncbi:energy transducer TonB [Spirosoma soli]|uniref:Energy transducer TonB n=1 Tax=Spirosoma soli TaxID=1770529 RepID=A0ABW5M9L2_9BACT
MKTIAYAVLCLTVTACTLVLSNTDSRAQSRSELVYTTAEREPEFPGGKAALSQYLAQNIRYPNSLARKNYSTGPVAAKFIIDKDGSIRDVRITTKPLDKENRKGMQEFMTTIVAAIEKMPRWRPGEVGGQPVAVFYTLPVEVNVQ